MDFSLTGESLKMYLQRKRPISVILNDVDTQSYIDYRYSDADANNRIIYNNMQQANSTMGTVYQAATSSAPSPSTFVGEVISKMVNMGFAGNDAKNLASRILPTVHEKNSGPVHSNAEKSQTTFISDGIRRRREANQNRKNPFFENYIPAPSEPSPNNPFSNEPLQNTEATAKGIEIQVQQSAGDTQIIFWMPGQYKPSLIIKLRL